jgi:methionyl aminopeptidase
MYTKIKSSAEIESMRHSGKILGLVLKIVQSFTKQGVSTKDMADLAAKELKALGGKPVFLGYHGFPHVMCISVNEEVIHGIPKADKIIGDGDVVSIDFGVNVDGMITDAARTFVVGNTKSADKLLIKKTEEALMNGISVVKSNTHIGDISSEIERILHSANLGIIKEYVGHGVGHQLHEEPNVPNYGKAGTGPVLYEGMTIAIEPMAVLGSPQVYVDNDDWTVVAADGSRAAHFEDTVLVTKNGFEILTRQ